jgi:hypothetical protein
MIWVAAQHTSVTRRENHNPAKALRTAVELEIA